MKCLQLFFTRVKLVRLGHPARLLPQILDSALDAQVGSLFCVSRTAGTTLSFFIILLVISSHYDTMLFIYFIALASPSASFLSAFIVSLSEEFHKFCICSRRISLICILTFLSLC